MTRRLLIPAAAALIAGAGACTNYAPDCSQQPAFSVTVADSATGAPLAAGATVLAISGTYRDSVIVPNTDSVYNRYHIGVGTKRPGVYTLLVRKTGYHDWQRDNIEVPKDCWVGVQEHEARLQPL